MGWDGCLQEREFYLPNIILIHLQNLKYLELTTYMFKYCFLLFFFTFSFALNSCAGCLMNCGIRGLVETETEISK